MEEDNNWDFPEIAIPHAKNIGYSRSPKFSKIGFSRALHIKEILNLQEFDKIFRDTSISNNRQKHF